MRDGFAVKLSQKAISSTSSGPLSVTGTGGGNFTISPTIGLNIQYNITALSGSATFSLANTSSSYYTDGQKMLIRIKDNGTIQTLTWTTTSGSFRAVSITLPTTTAAGKVLYVLAVYNSQDSYWDAISYAQQ